MKTSTKIGIGFSIATIAGIYATVTFSEKIIKKLEHEATRCKTKRVVNEKFDGNEKLLTIVDNLSDNELDSIDQVVTEIKHSRKKISDFGDKIKNSKDNFLDSL